MIPVFNPNRALGVVSHTNVRANICPPEKTPSANKAVFIALKDDMGHQITMPATRHVPKAHPRTKNNRFLIQSDNPVTKADPKADPSPTRAAE